MKFSLNKQPSLNEVASLESIQEPELEKVEGSTEPQNSSEALFQMPFESKEKCIFINRVYSDATKNSNVQIYILDAMTGIDKEQISEVTTTLMSLKESDVVDIVFNVLHFPMTIGLSVISAISACKAKVVTHASYVSSIPAVLAWFSGDEINVGSVSIIRMHHMNTAAGGEVADVKIASDFATNVQTRMLEELVSGGLLTEEEMLLIQKNRKEVNIFGAILKCRVDAINKSRKNTTN